MAVQAEHGGVAYSDWYDDFGNASEAKVYQAPEYDASLLIRKGCLHAVTALYPRSAFQQVGGFDEGLSHWEDWDLQLALAAAGVCGTRVPEALFTYRKAAGMRREANHAAFEQGKAAILGKWGRYWNGSEELMGCRSCPGGGGGKSVSAPPAPGRLMLGPQARGGAAVQAPEAAPEGAQLVEFIGSGENIVAYRGKVTGATYRFGAMSCRRTFRAFWRWPRGSGC